MKEQCSFPKVDSLRHLEEFQMEHLEHIFIVLQRAAHHTNCPEHEREELEGYLKDQFLKNPPTESEALSVWIVRRSTDFFRTQKRIRAQAKIHSVEILPAHANEIDQIDFAMTIHNIFDERHRTFLELVMEGFTQGEIMAHMGIGRRALGTMRRNVEMKLATLGT